MYIDHGVVGRHGIACVRVPRGAYPGVIVKRCVIYFKCEMRRTVLDHRDGIFHRSNGEVTE